MSRYLFRYIRSIYHHIRRRVWFVLKAFGHLEFCVLCRRLRNVGDRPASVAFLMVFDSVFSLENVFLLKLDNKDFDPYIIVIPDVSRGLEYQNKVMRQTLDTLGREYGARVRLSLALITQPFRRAA